MLSRSSVGGRPSLSEFVRAVLTVFTTRSSMTTSANLESELDEKLNAPSMEDQKSKYKKDIEKAISDRVIVMREVVVRISTFSTLSRSLSPSLHRKLRGVLRLSSKRWSKPV